MTAEIKIISVPTQFWNDQNDHIINSWR